MIPAARCNWGRPELLVGQWPGRWQMVGRCWWWASGGRHWGWEGGGMLRCSFWQLLVWMSRMGSLTVECIWNMRTNLIADCWVTFEGLITLSKMNLDTRSLNLDTRSIWTYYETWSYFASLLIRCLSIPYYHFYFFNFWRPSSYGFRNVRKISILRFLIPMVWSNWWFAASGGLISRWSTDRGHSSFF